MTTILEFLSDLMTDEGSQEAFLSEPIDYLELHQFSDLSGEDVAEAIGVLRLSLPDDMAARLDAYDGGGAGLPPVRPTAGETDLDAAVRQLTHATMLVREGKPVPERQPEPSQAYAPEPEFAAPANGNGNGHGNGHAEAGAAEWSAPAVTRDEPQDNWGVATGEGEHHDVGVAHDEDALTRAADRVDPFVAFGEELADIVRYATAKMDELIQRAEIDHERVVRQAGREAEAIRSQADEDAAAIRRAAEADAQMTRQNAGQEADSIVQSAAAVRAEADGVLESARAAHEESERRAADLLANAEATAAEMIGEARARREEIRDAERQVRERLQSVETIFRSLQDSSALPDEE
jgi:hypothetical protein